MADTILNVKWTDITLEEALAVSEQAHRSSGISATPRSVSTWITENAEHPSRFDVDTDGVTLATVSAIDRKLTKMREEQAQVVAQIAHPSEVFRG